MKSKPLAKKHPTLKKKAVKPALLLPKKEKRSKQPEPIKKSSPVYPVKKVRSHLDYFSFFKKILIPEEPIAGLEISDSSLRLILLSENKKTGLLAAKQFFEQELSSGIIVNGEIKNEAKLSAALINFKKSLKIPVDYVVASIPSGQIYTKTLAFPKNIDEEKLNEAIKLAINFQFPYKAEAVYYSWEINSEKNPQKVFIAEAPKSIINPYINCIFKAFNLIALEFHSASFSRAAVLEKNKPILLKITGRSGADFSIIENSTINFTRSLRNDLTENKINLEADKIINFYESTAGVKVTATIDLSKDNVSINKKIQFPPQKNSLWIIALGAACRGIIPRQEDNFFSLSPISAQKAYKYHKAVNFTSIITKLAIGLALFFVAAFLGTWILMITLERQDTEKKDDFSNLPSAIDLTAVEQKIKNANSLIAATANILKSSPQWSILVGNLQDLIIDGITVNSLNLQNPEGVISLTGVAKDRPTLNFFRDKLKESAVLKNINLPLTNLDQKTDIPFNISFELKNPSSLYLK
jgi:hypothetical protein